MKKIKKKNNKEVTEILDELLEYMRKFKKGGDVLNNYIEWTSLQEYEHKLEQRLGLYKPKKPKLSERFPILKYRIKLIKYE